LPFPKETGAGISKGFGYSGGLALANDNERTKRIHQAMEEM
jgi:hypothetical protein